MESIETTFSDNEGNHLLVALNFCDELYKQESLQIPEEYSNINIVDISIEKVYLEKPISHSVFFRMSSWLIEQFNAQDNAVFTYICSIDDLNTNHSDMQPQKYRWDLFDLLLQRAKSKIELNVQDVIVGPEGYQTFGRAFYRSCHAPIIHIVAAHLQDKQRQY